MIVQVILLALLLCASDWASANKSFQYDSTCLANCSSLDGELFSISVMLALNGLEKCPETVDDLSFQIRDGNFLTSDMACDDATLQVFNYYFISGLI